MVLQQITSTRNFPNNKFKPFGNPNSNPTEPYKINKKGKKQMHFLAIPLKNPLVNVHPPRREA